MDERIREFCIQHESLQSSNDPELCEWELHWDDGSPCVWVTVELVEVHGSPQDRQPSSAAVAEARRERKAY